MKISYVKRNKYIGRNIKGVSIYYKDMPNVTIQEIVNENGNLIILKISNKNWTSLKDLFLIVCYREDRESKFKTENFFEIIKLHIINSKMKHVMIMGDLNGRIGKLCDNKHLKLPPRKSDDANINRQGKDILDFCNETSLVIANGRLECGKCTYFTLYKEEVKKSMIDYLLISENLIENIDNFEIIDPVPYTDHAPMITHLTIPQKQPVARCRSARSWSKGPKRKHPFKWTKNNAKCFDNEHFKQKCAALQTRISRNPNELPATEIYKELDLSRDCA